MKIAVVLFNLGGPDCPENIEPFLMNFFTDKNIISLPYPFRYLVARMISKRRSKREAAKNYGSIGGKSPLLKNSQAQAQALEKKLKNSMHEFKSWVCMNYWHPMADEVARDVKNWGAQKIILLPLYPQFSTTTTKSSFEGWDRQAKQHLPNIPTHKICCYPWQDGFVKTSVKNICKAYEKAKKISNKPVRLLFSAHGLPEKIIKKGDPYQWQCEQSALIISRETGIENLDWEICYQSRVGSLKWIGPSTEEALEKAASDGVSVVIYPHAFTQEHVETLVELDIEYHELAQRLGILAYERVETVGVGSDYIEGLAELVEKHSSHENICSHDGERLCPSKFSKCPMGQKAT